MSDASRDDPEGLVSDTPDEKRPRESPAVPRPTFIEKGSHARSEFEARAQATVADIEAQFRATNAQLRATNARLEARAGRNLPLAIGIGLVLGVTLLGSLIFIKWLFTLFAVVLIGFLVFELASALRFAGRDVPRVGATIAGVCLVPAAFLLGAEGQWLVTLGAMVFLALWRLVILLSSRHRASARDVVTDIGAGTFVLAYCAFLGSFAVLLTAQPQGQWWTLAFLIVVIVSDVGAYATGLLFGRHKMAPIISPGKTWEGFAGAVVLSVIAGILVSIFMIHQPPWVGAIFGLVLVATATVGDLTESLIKRDLGIKDISSWLPGHGGFLDRLDSVLPSAAAAYGMYLIFVAH